MPELWQKTWDVTGDEHPGLLAIRLAIAAFLGVGIALTRTFARSDGRPSPGLRTTLLLLTVLTALITEVIGNNLARAFGLAGALAVIRFRTNVEDTRDSAFVIFSMATGMAVGAGYLATALVGFGIVSLVVICVTQITGAPAYDARIKLRLQGRDTTDAMLRTLFLRYSSAALLSGTETFKDGEMLLSYRIRPYHKSDMTKLLDELRALTGVMKVEWELD